MENLDIHSLESDSMPNRMPIQLPLIWNELSEEATNASPPLPDKRGAGPAPPIDMLQHNELIEAQAGRTKIVCLTLLGLGLVALHLY